MQSSESESVAIFWDYENCHAASHISGYEIANGIRNVAHRFGSVKSFKAYMEMPDPETLRSLSLRSELQSSGVSLIDCPHNGRKNVADQMIIVDMLTYAMDHPAPCTFILISGDRDFAYAVSVLRLRRYRVVIVSLPFGVHISLRSQASMCLDWNVDVMGLRPDSEAASIVQTPANAAGQSPILHRATYLGERESPSSLPIASFASAGGSRKEPPLQHSPPPPPPARPLAPEAVCVPSPAYSRNTAATSTTGLASPVMPRLPILRPNSTPSDWYYGPAEPPSSVAGPSRASPFAKDRTSTAEDLMSAYVHTVDDGTSTPLTQAIPLMKLDTPRLVATPLQTVQMPYQDKVPLKSPPPAFRSLVELLRKHWAKGSKRPLRSIIALELVTQDQQVYKKAGVERFAHLSANAKAAEVVLLGGADGHAWISLHPDWEPSGGQ